MRSAPVIRQLVTGSALVWFAGGTPAIGADALDPQRIFAEHCLECHGQDKAEGGLNLTTRAGLLQELESGAHAVVPGDPAKSELVARISTTDATEVMPPPKNKKRALNSAEIEALTKWVESGAEWKSHWAYEPIKRPPVPTGGHPIDAFIRAKLATKNIAPSPEADRITLIRRLSYDLLGLPPTVAEADAFALDRAPDAWVRLVERTLASPHFGERWGRHWLDQARYADSDGYEKDNARPDAWRYRDWVIDAINRDLPFDQFTIEQLAGDLLPDATPEQVLATAFHRQTLTNREGGVDQEQFRVEAVFDRTETTGSVWLAHTVGCARCHTHKYDRLTQREYYQLFAFFNNADETTAKVGSTREALAEFEAKNAAHLATLRTLRAKLEKAREPLAEKLPAWEKEIAARFDAAEKRKPALAPIAITSVTGRGKATFTKLDDGSWLAGGAQADTDLYTISAELPAGEISAVRLELLPDDSLPGKGPGRNRNGNFVLSEFLLLCGTDAAKSPRAELHSAKADFSQKGYDAAGAIDGNPETGWAVSGGTGKPHNATFQLVHPIDGALTPRVTVQISQQYSKQHSLGRFRLVALLGETSESIAPAEIARLVRIGSDKWTNEDREEITDWVAKSDPGASAAAEALARAEASGPKPPVIDARVLTQRRQARDTRVFHRGEFLSPTDPVQPGTPAILPPIRARADGAPDRLDLARWLVSRENPLTARVVANQVWMRLFGEGLVQTPGDFGVRGDKPTHPELLDWLAAEFMEHGWSRKHLVRMILTSATYRQRSDVRSELNDIDPRNTLLARQNRLRVEGEIVRDLHLAASGLLSRKIGGPSVFPPMPPEIAALSYAGNFKWNESRNEDRYRRGMYTFFKRTAPYPDLMTFDCPDANVASVRRTVSNTPLQALTTLNAATFSEAARTLASRALAAPGDDAAQMTAVFRSCLIRAPRAAEIQPLLGLLSEARAYYADHAGEAQKIAGDQQPAAEIAAWTAASRIILNTDEFITRE